MILSKQAMQTLMKCCIIICLHCYKPSTHFGVSGLTRQNILAVIIAHQNMAIFFLFLNVMYVVGKIFGSILLRYASNEYHNKCFIRKKNNRDLIRQCSPFKTQCFGSIRMDHAVCESCYKGTILQRNYRK